MGSAVLVGGRFADIQEIFSSFKRSDMDCVVLQGGLFADCMKWHFQAPKRSDNSSTILQDS